MVTNICKTFFIIALLANLTNAISANKNSARLAKSTPAINKSSARFAQKSLKRHHIGYCLRDLAESK